MSKPLSFVALCTLVAASLGAQAPAAAKPLPTVEEQIAASVLALPADLRAGATVMGYRTPGKLETIRAGKNGMNWVLRLETSS